MVCKIRSSRRIRRDCEAGVLRQKIDANANFGTNIDRLFVVETIPRVTLGKIQRDELKKMLQSIAEAADSPS
jgi:hypothetical protein